jgi:hypothetical protein
MKSSPTTLLFSSQAELLDDDGNPLNGDVNMAFQPHHQAEGATFFWMESYAGADMGKDRRENCNEE